MELTWKDESNNEAGFLIERQTGAGDWTDLATAAANATKYDDTTLIAGTKYSYRVRAVNSTGNSLPSNVVATGAAAPGGATAPASRPLVERPGTTSASAPAPAGTRAAASPPPATAATAAAPRL